MWLRIAVALICMVGSIALRSPRYASFDPSQILPENHQQTVKSGMNYTLTCTGKRGVSWRLSPEADQSLRSRVTVTYKVDRDRKNRRRKYMTQLHIRDLRYSDTSDFTCTYNGTTDLSSIDNSTKVHIYVEDPKHLLTQMGYHFFMVVQSQTFTLPCTPTHPDINVTLWRAEERMEMDEYISFDPKVRHILSTNVQFTSFLIKWKVGCHFCSSVYCQNIHYCYFFFM